MFTCSFKDKEHWSKWYPDSSPTDIFPAGFSPTDSCPRAFTRRAVPQRTIPRGIVPRTDISFDNFSCCQKYIFPIKIFNRFSKVFDCIIDDLLPADISGIALTLTHVDFIIAHWEWLMASWVVENSRRGQFPLAALFTFYLWVFIIDQSRVLFLLYLHINVRSFPMRLLI